MPECLVEPQAGIEPASSVWKTDALAVVLLRLAFMSGRSNPSEIGNALWHGMQDMFDLLLRVVVVD